MASPAHAIGRELLRRHRWPLIGMAVYLAALVAIKLLGLGPTDTIAVVPPDGRAAVLIAPLSTAFFYYLAVFSFGFAGDLAARRSIFPARMFTLPVATRTLVRGPMMWGTGTVALLMMAATLVARWPWGVKVPLVWPALLAAAVLAWTQALIWMPYGLPGLRAIITVLCLGLLDAAVLLAVHFEVSEGVMLAILAPQIPLAYFTACVAVGRARRGEVPEWAPFHARPFGKADRPPRRKSAFASPGQAHAWFEWRRQGWSLPVVVAIVLPFELALLWIATDAPMMVLEVLLIVLVTPLGLAAFAATNASRTDPAARDPHGVPPFVATRPLTSAALIAAKLRAAMRGTLVTWLLVLVATPLALAWSDTLPPVIARASRFVEVVGMPRAVVFAFLVLGVLVASTWKQLVQSLFIGLTGRAWLIRSSVIAALAFVVFIGPVVQWIVDDKVVQALIWSATSSILSVLVALKMLAAATVAARLVGSGLLNDRSLVAGAAGWAATVFALYGVLVWLVDAPLIPRYIPAMVAILLVPLARLSAAPLALAWNRHR